MDWEWGCQMADISPTSPVFYC